MESGAFTSSTGKEALIFFAGPRLSRPLTAHHRNSNFRFMTTILSADGSLQIPEQFRKTDGLKPGQQCDIQRVGHGDYRVHVSAETQPKKESWVKILRDCPEKDWWEPLDHSNLVITRDSKRLFDEE
jgi:hypothetical protein